MISILASIALISILVKRNGIFSGNFSLAIATYNWTLNIGVCFIIDRKFQLQAKVWAVVYKSYGCTQTVRQVKTCSRRMPGTGEQVADLQPSLRLV